jgi:hypothetical protein
VTFSRYPDRWSFDQARGGFAESGPVMFEEKKADVYRREPPTDLSLNQSSKEYRLVEYAADSEEGAFSGHRHR